jgi:hypothetical protein
MLQRKKSNLSFFTKRVLITPECLVLIELHHKAQRLIEVKITTEVLMICPRSAFITKIGSIDLNRRSITTGYLLFIQFSGF